MHPAMGKSFRASAVRSILRWMGIGKVEAAACQSDDDGEQGPQDRRWPVEAACQPCAGLRYYGVEETCFRPVGAQPSQQPWRKGDGGPTPRAPPFPHGEPPGAGAVWKAVGHFPFPMSISISVQANQPVHYRHVLQYCSTAACTVA